MLEWDNTMEEVFEGLETVVNIYNEGARVRRAVGEAPTHTSRVSHKTVQLRIPFSEHAWETEARGKYCKKEDKTISYRRF